MKTISLALLLAVPLTLAVVAAPSVAAGPAFTVSYADLDLASADDRRVLDRRLRDAVAQACGPTSNADLAGTNRVLACRAETLASARERLAPAIAAARAATPVRLAAQR